MEIFKSKNPQELVVSSPPDDDVPFSSLLSSENAFSDEDFCLIGGEQALDRELKLSQLKMIMASLKLNSSPLKLIFPLWIAFLSCNWEQ
nr:hypothetical protein Itr_chr10CG01670 [Ipomoea trifida]